MTAYKCKKSVFCAYFLVFFFLGTICGSVLFSLLQLAAPQWITTYISALTLQRPASPVSAFLLFGCPLAVVGLLGILSFGRRLILFCALLYGLVLSYVFSACFTAGVSAAAVLLRELFRLPAFYALSLFLWMRQTIPASGSTDLNIRFCM